MIGVPLPPSHQPSPTRGEMVFVYVVASLALLVMLGVILAYLLS